MESDLEKKALMREKLGRQRRRENGSGKKLRAKQEGWTGSTKKLEK